MYDRGERVKVRCAGDAGHDGCQNRSGNDTAGIHEQSADPANRSRAPPQGDLLI
jgi:hypothetical protein